MHDDVLSAGSDGRFGDGGELDELRAGADDAQDLHPAIVPEPGQSTLIASSERPAVHEAVGQSRSSRRRRAAQGRHRCRNLGAASRARRLAAGGAAESAAFRCAIDSGTHARFGCPDPPVHRTGQLRRPVVAVGPGRRAWCRRGLGGHHGLLRGFGVRIPDRRQGARSGLPDEPRVAATRARGRAQPIHPRHL